MFNFIISSSELFASLCDGSTSSDPCRKVARATKYHFINRHTFVLYTTSTFCRFTSTTILQCRSYLMLRCCYSKIFEEEEDKVKVEEEEEEDDMSWSTAERERIIFCSAFCQVVMNHTSQVGLAVCCLSIYPSDRRSVRPSVCLLTFMMNLSDDADVHVRVLLLDPCLYGVPMWRRSECPFKNCHIIIVIFWSGFSTLIMVIAMAYASWPNCVVYLGGPWRACVYNSENVTVYLSWQWWKVYWNCYWVFIKSILTYVLCKVKNFGLIGGG